MKTSHTFVLLMFLIPQLVLLQIWCENNELKVRFMVDLPSCSQSLTAAQPHNLSCSIKTTNIPSAQGIDYLNKSKSLLLELMNKGLCELLT